MDTNEKSKTVITASLSATFETVEEAIEFVNSVKDAAKITNFSLHQYEQYEGDLPY